MGKFGRFCHNLRDVVRQMWPLNCFFLCVRSPPSCKLFSSSFSALVYENVWPPFSSRRRELKQKLSNFVESGILSGRQIGHRHVMMSAASDSPICSSRSNVSKLSSSRHDEEKKLEKSLYHTVIITHLLIVLCSSGESSILLVN